MYIKGVSVKTLHFRGSSPILAAPSLILAALSYFGSPLHILRVFLTLLAAPLLFWPRFLILAALSYFGRPLHILRPCETETYVSVYAPAHNPDHTQNQMTNFQYTLQILIFFACGALFLLSFNGVYAFKIPISFPSKIQIPSQKCWN